MYIRECFEKKIKKKARFVSFEREKNGERFVYIYL